MKKPLFVISCPVDTYSGYGGRSRDLVKSIIELDKYDVKILSQPWGNTKWGFIDDHKKEWGFLNNHLISNLNTKPDVWMQITVPNEFQPVGNYNIGVTAAIETTQAPGEWAEGCNRMDLVLVSSKHSKSSLSGTWGKLHPQTKQQIGQFEVTTPIEVLFEGVDINKYLPINEPCKIDFDIPESFAFLSVGHWLPGEVGEDRKNIGLLIKAFLETFKNKNKKPALILKTSKGNSSYVDRNNILKNIEIIRNSVDSKNLPNIYLLHGDFSDEEMNSLYNHSKVKAMISLTKGEGFGRPLLEFSMVKKPIIASGWGGQVDFLNSEFTALLPGQLTPVHPSAANNMILLGTQWFSPDLGAIGGILTEMFINYKKYKELANRQAYYAKTNFSFDKMKEKVDEILDKNLPEFAQEIELVLPDFDLEL